jgi:hypothetical protein
MDRATILAEIRRAATESGGKSLGRTQFERLTGISEDVWLGKYWLRWSDAVIEAGFTPGRMQEAHPDEHLFECLAVLTLKRGHFPTASELKMERTQDKSFPNAGVFERLGSKSDRIETLRKFARAKGYDDVLALLPAEPSAAAMPRDESSAEQSGEGHEYMLKLGKHFKVGRTFAVPRRHREIALELPEKPALVHAIQTDDPEGIELYWHRRFAAKQTNGEWFALNAQDVRAFKRRKFM